MHLCDVELVTRTSTTLNTLLHLTVNMEITNVLELSFLFVQAYNNIMFFHALWLC
jgi:hypothetical protein